MIYIRVIRSYPCLIFITVHLNVQSVFCVQRSSSKANIVQIDGLYKIQINHLRGQACQTCLQFKIDNFRGQAQVKTSSKFKLMITEVKIKVKHVSRYKLMTLHVKLKVKVVL